MIVMLSSIVALVSLLTLGFNVWLEGTSSFRKQNPDSHIIIALPLDFNHDLSPLKLLMPPSGEQHPFTLSNGNIATRYIKV